jgi:hypothetical protein
VLKPGCTRQSKCPASARRSYGGGQPNGFGLRERRDELRDDGINCQIGSRREVTARARMASGEHTHTAVAIPLGLRPGVQNRRA